MQKYAFPVLALLLVFASLNAFSVESGSSAAISLAVHVFSLGSNAPLAGVKVSAFEGKTLVSSSITDSLGNAALSVSANSRIEVKTEKAGYYSDSSIVLTGIQRSLNLFISAPSALGSGFLGKARFLVVDEKGFPVSGASVAIISKDSNQIIAGLESDFSGRVNSDFEFSSGKEYSVRASKVGYLNSTIDWNPASATEIAKIVLPVDQNYKIQQAIRYPKNIPRVVTTVPSGIPERAVNPAETAMQIASASVTGIDFSKSVPKPVIENGRQKYEFEVWKTGKLFFLIDVSVPAGKIIVDPETGEVERAGVPWYASLISG